MKQFIIKLASRFAYYGMNVSAFPKVCSVLIQALNSPQIQNGFKEVRKLKLRDIKGDGSKYLHPILWLPENALRVVNLSLDRLPPCRILDLGAGPGYFIVMARTMQHEACGIDLGEHPIYTPLNSAFGNRIIWHKITPERPYPTQDIRASYDFITAFSVTFDRHGRGIKAPSWSQEDWLLFFSNLKPLLHKDSKVVLQLNTRTFLGCRGSEFKVFRSGLLRNVGFECVAIGNRFVELFLT